MKRLLILTGPQGAGNHAWSKIFALHPEVFGWRELLDAYWIGHDREPFSDCWRNVGQLKDFDWAQSDYYATSISVPYMENGVSTVPDIKGFINQARDLGIATTLAVIGRDRNVLGLQESRLRGGMTYDRALETYQDLQPDHYLSYELLQLYRGDYLRTLSQQMGFPIAWQHPGIDNILSEDANSKYFHPVSYHWVDDLARKTSSKWR